MGRFYEIVLEKDHLENGDATWLVTVPDFPEIVTDGETQENACRNAIRAIEEAISARISDGHDVPSPVDDTPGVARMVQISALTFLKCALYSLCRANEISRAELMRRLDWKRESVDRLFRIDHKSQLGQLEDAFEAIGHPLDFDMDYPAAA